MVHIIALVLLAAVYAEARIFNNPILSDKDYTYPGAIKVNVTYYVVASTADITKGIYPIHTSTDLMEWKPAGFIFNESNKPTWAVHSLFYHPKIHQIGSNFLLYFSAQNCSSTVFHVGVAIAPYALGPYTPIDRPLLQLGHNSSRYPTIIDDAGKLYLLFSNGTYEIQARHLNPNGISFSTDQTITLLKPNLTWEASGVHSPWYIKRGTYHYILYSAASDCQGVGVARSTQALGPYEKLATPISMSNSTYTCMRDVSVVKDVDEKADLIFLNANRPDDPTWSVVVAELSWGADNWPYLNSTQLATASDIEYKDMLDELEIYEFE